MQTNATLAATPEEQLEQERRKAAEQEREIMRTAQEAYEALATRMDDLLTGAQQTKLLDFFELNYLQQCIMAFHDSSAGTLFDILQLVRFGAKYYTYHALNVALLNLTIGKMLGFGPLDLERLVEAGIVIDVGMLLLPAKILDGDKPLNDFDRAMIKKHPEFTINVLQRSGLTDDSRLLDTVASHHERFNGSGYPKGLSGEDILLEARITAVSDSFDAASARRGYRAQKSPFAILGELHDNADGLLDPAIAGIAAFGIAQLLVGRFVVLSDRSEGKVVEVLENNIAYPAVVVVGRRVQTGPNLHPISLSSRMRLF